VNALNEDLTDLLKDLLFINAVIATELIRITENTAIIAKKPEEKVVKCIKEHNNLNERILKIIEKYIPNIEPLKSHVLPH
jgi:hypothetical protein